MKICFLLDRSNFLKTFGPIFDAAQGRGWEVEFWLPNEDGYLSLNEGDLIALTGDFKIRKYQSQEELLKLARESNIDALFSLWTKKIIFGRNDVPLLFVTLQETIDSFIAYDPENLASSDLICLYTPYWTNWAAEYYEAHNGHPPAKFKSLICDKVAFTGFPQMDVFKKIDPDEIRDRLGIPTGKKVVLFLPMLLRNKSTAWAQFFETDGLFPSIKKLVQGSRKEGKKLFFDHWTWALKGWNDRRLTKAIHDFCIHNNAILIGKGRRKDPFRPALMEIAFRCFYDEEYYPATIHQLLAISDLCIHTNSTVVLESAQANTPCFLIDCPCQEVSYAEEPTTDYVKWGLKKDGEANWFPGLTWWMPIPDVIRKFSKMSLNHFTIDPGQRARYIKKFNGPEDGKAGERVLDAVENAIGKKLRMVHTIETRTAKNS